MTQEKLKVCPFVSLGHSSTPAPRRLFACFPPWLLPSWSGLCLISQGALIKAKDGICAVNWRSEQRRPFHSFCLRGSFVPSWNRSSLPPFLPSFSLQLLSCLNNAGHVGKMLTGQPVDEAGGGFLSGTRHRWRCHLPGWRRDERPEQLSRPCYLSVFWLLLLLLLLLC